VMDQQVHQAAPPSGHVTPSINVTAFGMTNPYTQLLDHAGGIPPAGHHTQAMHSTVQYLLEEAEEEGTHPASTWVWAYTEEGVVAHVHREPVDGVVAVKATIHSKASGKKVFDLLADFSKRSTHDKMFDYSGYRVLHDYGAGVQLAQWVFTIPLFPNRDFCNIQFTGQLEPGLWVVAFSSVEDDLCPPDKLVRAQMRCCGYVIREKPNGGSQIGMVIDIDLAGSGWSKVQGWATRKASRNFAMQVREIDRLASK